MDTRVGDHIKYINREINELNKLHNLNVDLSKEKVEILVINDGADSVKTNNFAYKTNAITLYGMNNELKDLCIKNKGKYIYVKGSTSKDIKEFGD